MQKHAQLSLSTSTFPKRFPLYVDTLTEHWRISYFLCLYHIAGCLTLITFPHVPTCLLTLGHYTTVRYGIMNTKKNYSYILMMVKPFLCETICRHTSRNTQYRAMKNKSSHSFRTKRTRRDFHMHSTTMILSNIRVIFGVE